MAVQQGLMRSNVRTYAAVQDALARGQAVAIMRGYALKVEAFAVAENIYEERQIVQLARAVAAQECHVSARLAGPTALLAHGVSHWNEDRLPVYLQVDRIRDYRKDPFLDVIAPRAGLVEAVPLKLTIIGRPRQVTEFKDIAPCVDLLTASIQCVRLLPEEAGFVAFIMGTQEVVQNDRWDLEGTRSRLAFLQGICLDECWELPRRARGRARFFNASRHMVHPMDSVFEARLAWLLLKAGLDNYVTQHELHTVNGRYFLDFAFPQLRVAIEPDGRAKFGATIQEVHDAREALEYRREAIERAGWIVVRVAWQELRNPQALERRIRSALLRADRP